MPKPPNPEPLPGPTPHISIKSPEGGSWPGGSHAFLPVSGRAWFTCDDPGGMCLAGEILGVQVQFGDSAPVTATVTRALDGSADWAYLGPLPPTLLGSTLITATVTVKSGGQTGTERAWVTVTITDATGPDITNIQQQPPVWSGSGDNFAVTLTGTASDPQTGVRWVEWSLDGTHFSLATPAAPRDWTTWTVQASPLHLGANTVSFRAIDGVRPVGNWSKESRQVSIEDPISVQLDRLPGTVHPDPGSGTTATVVVTGTAADPLVTVASVAVDVDGNPVLTSPAPGASGWDRWTATVVIPALGPHVIRAVATSAVGVTAAAQATVEVVFEYPLEDPTPVAYLRDLLGFAHQRIRTGKDPQSSAVDPASLVSQFFQPFDRVSSTEPVSQARLAIEVLRGLLATLTVPAGAQADLAAAEAGYRQAGYEALLAEIGTSYAELRLARSAGDAARLALAQRLGIARLDRLDALLVSGDQLTEAWLEQVFGLRDTTRDPLTDTPSGQLLSWQREHLGTIWAAQDHPAGPQPNPPVPLIDPDLIARGEILASTAPTPDTALSLWDGRRAWIDARLADLSGDQQAGESAAARLQRLIDTALGEGTRSVLSTLAKQAADGQNIDAALAQVGIAKDAFAHLMRMWDLAQTGPLLDPEWQDVYSILVQVQKTRRYPTWLAEESDVVLSPQVFRFGDTPPTLPAWRATSTARRALQDRLRARDGQQQALATALAGAVAAAEATALPLLRDALVSAVGAGLAGGMPVDNLPDALSERLLIDMRTSGALRTSRLDQAVETVQAVLLGVRTGRLASLPPALGANPMASWRLAGAPYTSSAFDQEWTWMGAYATWRSAMQVFQYPENYLAASRREAQPQSQAFLDLAEDFTGAGRVAPDQARQLARNYLLRLQGKLAHLHAQNGKPVSEIDPTEPLPDDLSIDEVPNPHVPGLTDELNTAQLDTRRAGSQTALTRHGNTAPPPAFGSPPPPVYLREVFWDVPMYIAGQLQSSRQFAAALAWYHTVYAFSLPAGQRRIDYGLVLEHGWQSKYERSAQWLVDGLNPHDIAARRADAYTQATALAVVRCLLDYADAQFAAETPEALPQARALYLQALDLLGSDDLQPATPASIAPNPVPDALRQHAELNLFKLRNGRNIAGLETATVNLSTMDGASQAVAVAPPQPSPYRYATLADRARQLVALAQQVEGSFLAALEKRDAETYNLLRARQDLGTALANVRLQDARVVVAQDGEALAHLQKDRATLQQNTYQQWLSAGLNNSERTMIENYRQLRDAKNAIADVDSVLTIAQLMTTALSGGFLGTGGSEGLAPALLGTVGSVLKDVFSRTANEAEASAQINSVQASYERRAQEWQLQRSLAERDVGIANQQIQSAKDQVSVTMREREVAWLQADHAQSMVHFLANKFTNADLYDWMSRVLGTVYSYLLQQATAVARLAENQLAFERQERPRVIIQTDYWQQQSMAGGTTPDQQTDRMGLTGSARLMADITRLDQYAFDTNQRKLQLTKTLSLARLAPLEFQRFRQTGVLPFATPMVLFDQDFPGHYLRLIRRVRVSLVALIPPNQGIRAVLSSAGVSRVVLGDELFSTALVRRQPESVALSTPMNATGLFELDAQPELLLPFEGMGVDTAWQLELPRPANPFDYDSIADVLVSIDYTALHSFDLRQRVVTQIEQPTSADRPYSFRQQFADQWYDLHNPDQSATPMVVRFSTARQDFPSNVDDLAIQHVLLYFARADGTAFEVPVKSLSFTPTGRAPITCEAATTSIDGVISTRRVNGSSWLAILGNSVVGNWELALPTTGEEGGSLLRERFDNDEITDILFVLTFTGHLPEWPS